jgi:hypothetical protein
MNTEARPASTRRVSELDDDMRHPLPTIRSAGMGVATLERAAESEGAVTVIALGTTADIPTARFRLVRDWRRGLRQPAMRA